MNVLAQDRPTFLGEVSASCRENCILSSRRWAAKAAARSVAELPGEPHAAGSVVNFHATIAPPSLILAPPPIPRFRLCQTCVVLTATSYHLHTNLSM